MTRQHTPGPWHDGIARHYDQLRHTAPALGVEYLAGKHGLQGWEVITLWAWVRQKEPGPCPV